ncbi:TPA: hypothetical protein ACGUPM_002660 [Vibrio vulnificus]
MASRFESARELLRASIADCFGQSLYVMTRQGDQKPITGYVRRDEKGTRQVLLLQTDAELPEGCTTVYGDKRYQLVFKAPVKVNGTDSQIMREYVLVQEGSGASREWSEF